MKRRRGGRWAWLAACAVGLLVFLDGTPRAEAAPDGPATPEAPADVRSPEAPQDHKCSWQDKKYIKRVDGGLEITNQPELKCDGSIPRERDHLPALPEGCTIRRTAVPMRPSGWAATCPTQTSEELDWPPEFHPCSWEQKEEGDDWVARLTCPDTVVTPTKQDDQPPLPAGCKRRTGSGGIAGAGAAPVTCASPGMQEIDCRDEVDFWFDDHETVEIPANPPDWYLTAVELESKRDEGQGCDLARHPPHKLCAEIDKTKYDPPGLLPDECWGTYPTALYEMSWEDGGWTDVGKYKTRIMGWVASFLFTVGRSGIQVVLWLVEWAFTFDVTDYSDTVTSIADKYDENIVGPWGLKDIAWFVLISYLGFTTLKGKIGQAGGEMLVALVVGGLATVLLTNQEMYLDSMSDAMTLASDDLFAAGTETGERTDVTDRHTQILEPLQLQIHKEFVEEAYMYLNWGASSDQLKATSDTCLERAQNIASTGWDGDGWPAMWMGGYSKDDHTCDEFAEFNRDVSNERLGGALLTMAVALVVTACLGLMAITLLLSKFLLAVLFTLIPFVVVAAVLPGAGRRLAWNWAAAAAQTFVAVLVVSWVATMMLLGSGEMLDATQAMKLHERWGLLLLIAVAAYTGFQRARASSQTFAGHFADALTRLSPVSSGWSGRGSVGVDFKHADRAAGRGAKLAGVAAAAPAMFAGASTVRRWQERRTARRSLGNMRYMERQRTRPTEEYRIDTYQFGNRPAAPPAGPSSPAPAVAPAPAAPASSGGLVGPGGRPLPSSSQPHPAAARAQAAGGVLLTPRQAGPPPGPARSPGGQVDGEYRERWEMVAKIQSPPAFLRHPIRNVQDRIGNRTTMRQARRRAQDIRENYRDGFVPDYFVDRGQPHVKERYAPRPQSRFERWVPPAARNRVWRATRGWN